LRKGGEGKKTVKKRGGRKAPENETGRARKKRKERDM